MRTKIGNRSSIKEFLRKYATALSTVVIFMVFATTINNFLNVDNMFMMLRQISMRTIMAFGFIFVMGSGGFDMSVGNTVGLVNIILAVVLVATKNVWLAVGVSVACGLLVGYVNGALTAYAGLPDFIATYSVGSIAYGIKMLMTKGSPIYFPAKMPSFFYFLGQGHVGAIPFPVIIMLVVFFVAFFVLTKTPFGRRIYAVGGNPVASLYAGINVRKYKMAAYMISGVAVAIAAILLTSWLGSAQPLAGEDYLLDVIAAAFLSTTMFGNGEPTAVGVLVGSFLIGMLTTGLTMLNVQYYFQYMVKGLVVIIAVLLSVLLGQKIKMKV